MRVRRAPLLLSLGVACLLIAAPTAAQIYRWVAEDGIAHFTDRPEEVPPRYRDQLEDATGDLDQKRRLTRFGKSAPTSGSDEADSSGAGDSLAAPAPDWGELQRRLEADGLGALLGGLGIGSWAAFLVGLALFLGLALAIGSLFLRLACRIARELPPRFWKGCAIVGAQLAVGTAFSALVALVLGLGSEPGVGAAAAQFGASLLLQAAVLRGLFLPRFGKALVITLVANLLAAASALAAVLVVVFGIGSLTGG